MGEGNIGDDEIMGSYGAAREIRKDRWLGICQENGFGDCQHLFQEDEHRMTYKRGGKSTQVPKSTNTQ